KGNKPRPAPAYGFCPHPYRRPADPLEHDSHARRINEREALRPPLRSALVTGQSSVAAAFAGSAAFVSVAAAAGAAAALDSSLPLELDATVAVLPFRLSVTYQPLPLKTMGGGE